MRRSWETANGSPPAKGDVDDQINNQIEEQLDRFDNGEGDGFWNATRLLTVVPGSKYLGDSLDPDVTGMARWPTLSEGLNERMVDAAERYLRSYSCERHLWLDKPQIRLFPAEAGYRAMVLLLRVAVERLQQLPAKVWLEWAPVLASSPTFTGDAAWEDKVKLLELGGPEARDAVRSALLARVTAKVSAGERPFARNEAGYLWDDNLAGSYLSLAQTAAAEPRAELVATLAMHGFDLLRPLLLEWLADASDPERRRLAATQLIDNDLAQSWPDVQAALDTDLAFAQRVLGDSLIVQGYNQIDQAPASILGDIYLWLRETFPPESDPQFEEAHMVGPREYIGHWRDRLIGDLRDRGTREAVDAVRKITSAFPTDGALKRTLALAEAALRRNQWIPTPLDQLLHLAADRCGFLVNDVASLAFAVSAALEEIQTRLIGATPESHYLWDTHIGRPKTEDEISDYLANELTRTLTGQGLVVNREVQIRRDQPSGIGQRPDILVEAVLIDGPNPDRVSLPIEVKGAWHGELLTAMSSQLVERYMYGVGSSRGIYLVAWPDLGSWRDTGDGRRRRLVEINRAENEAQLAEQAASLASEGVFVRIVHLDISYRRSG